MRPAMDFVNQRSYLTVVIALCYVGQYSLSISCLALNDTENSLAGPIGHARVITTKESPNRSPLVFIPGDAGSQLEARLNKTSVPHYLCDKISDWFDLWLNLHLFAFLAIDCLFDNLKLSYDNKTRMTKNTDGVEIRVTKFGSLESVDYLDIIHMPGTDYFDEIISTLIKENGYIYDVDMVGAGFDFRKAPNELGDYFDDLRELIENHYINNNYRPVTLICHSMGCLNSLYLLNHQTENWKEVYVKRLIALGAPWSGSFKAVTAMLYGDNLGIPLLDPYKLRALQSSFPSLMYLFPREPSFNETSILIETPTKNYSLSSLDELFFDAKMLDQREMWLDTKAIAANLTAPNVELWCLYGTGAATPSKVIFHDSLDTNKYTEIEGEGDGTVNLDSLKACENFASQQKKSVYVKMFEGIDHIGILRNFKPASFISANILGEDLF